MKIKMYAHTLFLASIICCGAIFGQTAACDGQLPFEEQNGLLTIEMESGNLPSSSNWQVGSEADPNLSGATINYIFWDGTESFNALSGTPITYNIKINNPGTYRLVCRSRIGTGTSNTEHNDVWLRIVADDFYATKQNDETANLAVEPTPNCNNNTNRDCAEGAKVDGYFKAYMNRHPVNLPVDERWGFVTNTNDQDAFRFIWATFNNPGNYSIIIDARSSFFFMDKMVLRRTDVSDNSAFNLTNNESSCATLSLNDNTLSQNITLYPNPVHNTLEISTTNNYTGVLVIRNILGTVVKKFKLQKSKQSLDVTNFKSGVYVLTTLDKDISITKKFIKL